LILAANTIKTFFNRGTVVSSTDFIVEDPEATVKFFLSKGFHKGIDERSFTLNDKAPLNFRMITEDEFKIQENPEA
jgi:hypothetical protein